MLQSVKRLQQISVVLVQAQSLQEGLRGAESLVLQPRRTSVFSTSRVPQRLKAALSLPVLATESQISSYKSKDLLWGKDMGSKSRLTVLRSDAPVVYFLPSNHCWTPSTF